MDETPLAMTERPTGDAAARIDLAAAHRLAVWDDLHEGSWNHLSLKVPTDPERILISPPATHWSTVTASSLVELGPEDQAELEKTASMQWIAYRIHAPIHRARPDASCVLHAHCPHATAIAMLEDSVLPLAEQNVLDFVGKIAYTDVYDGFGPQDIGHGQALAEALGDKRILFIKNHGVVVVGPSIGEAYTDLYLLERTCRALVLAYSTGKSLRTVPEEVARRYAQENEDMAFKVDHFEAMKLVLDDREPDYKS